MNRKIYASILVALVCLAFGFLTGCSSSKTYTVSISTPPPTSMTAGSTATIVATTNDTAGVNWSCTSTPSGSCGSFSPTTSLSGANVTYTAPSAAASVTITATSVTKPSVSASATVTVTVVTATYVFYASGLEQPNATNSGLLSYYAIAGAFTLDESASPPTVVAGELDYNDGTGTTETDVQITGGASSITTSSTTGQGTITLNTSNTNLGPTSNPGVITLAVQFVNPGHALISQFDGSATSSGGMDLQTATTPGSAASNLAFTLSGVDEDYEAVGYGGVFTVTGSGTSATFSGTVDVNDDGTAVPTGTLGGGVTSTTDSFGRGTATFAITNAAVPTGSVTLSLAFYVVGPEVIRFIDVDAENTTAKTFGPAAVGSLYGQGTNATTASASSLVTSVFGIESNSAWLFTSTEPYAAAGQIVPNSTTGTIGGEGDVDEGYVVTATGSTITAGNYLIADNGYGSITGIAGLGDVATLGLYATDPTLNLYDPNNTTSGLGGALLLEMDSTFTSTGILPSGGTGFLTPQASTTAATDLNNSYGFGAQDFNDVSAEFDTVGQAPIASLVLTSATGEISDPNAYFTSTGGEYTAVPFAGTATGPDPAGRYSLPLTVGPVVSTSTTMFPFTVVMYEASGNFVFWIDEDTFSLWLGTLEIQSSTAKSSVKRQPAAKTQASSKP